MAGLRRDLGLPQLSVAGVGVIMGAGIFVLIGAATDRAGPLVWVSFLLAALVSLFTAMSYAELAAMFPRAGASFEFARQAFGMRVAFVTGWLACTAEIVAAAAVALGFGAYLHALTGANADVSAIGLLVVGVGIGATGALRSVGVAGALTLIELGGLAAVTIIGFSHFHFHYVDQTSSVGAVLGGAALVFFAFIGFEDLATFAEEARDPQWTVPRAIFISVGASTVVYTLVAVASVGALGATVLGHEPAPMEAVARVALSNAAGDLIAAIGVAATAKTTLLLLMASSRRIYGMAEAGALPPLLGRLSGHSQVPVAGMAIVAGLAALITRAGSLSAIAGVTNFALFVAFCVVNASVIALRREAPDASRSFRVPFIASLPLLGPTPVLPLLGTASSLALVASLSVGSLLGGAALLLTGLVLTYLLRERHTVADAA